MKRLLILLQFIIVLAITCVIFFIKITPDIEYDIDKMHLLGTTEFGYYDLVDDSNKMQCDLMTYSSLVNRMQADGYVIDTLVSDSSTLEVILTKDDVTFRLHYDASGEFTSICKEYEKSYVPFTYINDED